MRLRKACSGGSRRLLEFGETIAHPDDEPVGESLVQLRAQASEHARVGGVPNQQMHEREGGIVEERGVVGSDQPPSLQSVKCGSDTEPEGIG